MAVLEYNLTTTTDPTLEPVTLAEAKRHVEVNTDEHNTQLLTLITTARELVEAESKRSLITQTKTQTQREFPASSCPIELMLPPLQSVTSLKYLDSDGTLQTITSTNYTVDTAREPGQIWPVYNYSWPLTRDVFNAVQIIYVAGYGDNPTDVASAAKHAILLKIGELFEGREPTPKMLSSYDALIHHLEYGAYP